MLTGFKFKIAAAAAALTFLGGSFLVTAPLNAPRPLEEYASNTLFSSFSGRSPKTLDPQASYSSDETIYTYQICDTLYGYHYLKRPYEIVPRAASGLPEITYLDKDMHPAADPGQAFYSRYRITLKKGIRFAPHPAFVMDKNGAPLYANLNQERARPLKSPLELPQSASRELTAEDFVYGIKRIASPRVLSPVYSLMLSYLPELKTLHDALLKDVPEDPYEWMDLRKYSLRSVRAPDRYTLEITIRGKSQQFINWLAMAFFAPAAWEAECFYSNRYLARNNISLATWPVGTGPFMMQKSIQNREHVMVRNPVYRYDPYPGEGEAGDSEKGLLADAGKPMPFIDRVVMTLEKESVPVTTKFLQGYYDSPQVTRLDVGQGFVVAAGDSPDKARLYGDRKLYFPQTTEANLWYIGFNWLDPVVGKGKTPEQAEKNRLLRQAISIAIDWEEQIAIFEKGQGTPAAGLLPPGLFGYSPSGRTGFNPVVYERDSAGAARRKSIDEARRLMEQAGYPSGRDAVSGKQLVLNFDWQGASAGSRSFLDWMRRQFAKLGIELEIRATDYNRFQDKMARGSAQIYYWGWLADYPDAENFLFLLYGPNAKASSGGSGENASNYQNAEYDAIFEKMRSLPNNLEKAALIDRMTAIAQEDAPWSFGYYPTSVAAFHHWVGNAKPTQMVRNNIQYMKIDPKERVESVRAWNRPVLWPAAALAILIFFGIWTIWARQSGKSRLDAQGRLGEDL